MGQHWSALPYPQLPLDNAVTALAVCACCPSSYPLLRSGAGIGASAGRLQPLGEQPGGAGRCGAQPHSAAYLPPSWPTASQRVHPALCGMLRDKDIEHTLEVMAPHVDEWFLAGSAGAQSGDGCRLTAFFTGCDEPLFRFAAAAYGAVLAEANPEDVVVFGSFYTVADVMAWI